MCVGHDTNLTCVNPVTGIYRQAKRHSHCPGIVYQNIFSTKVFNYLLYSMLYSFRAGDGQCHPNDFNNKNLADFLGYSIY